MRTRAFGIWISIRHTVVRVFNFQSRKRTRWIQTVLVCRWFVTSWALRHDIVILQPECERHSVTVGLASWVIDTWQYVSNSCGKNKTANRFQVLDALYCWFSGDSLKSGSPVNLSGTASSTNQNASSKQSQEYVITKEPKVWVSGKCIRLTSYKHPRNMTVNFSCVRVSHCLTDKRAASVDEVLTLFLYDLHIHVEYTELNSSTVVRLEDAHFVTTSRPCWIHVWCFTGWHQTRALDE